MNADQSNAAHNERNRIMDIIEQAIQARQRKGNAMDDNAERMCAIFGAQSLREILEAIDPTKVRAKP